jgi:hypothetical protein
VRALALFFKFQQLETPLCQCSDSKLDDSARVALVLEDDGEGLASIEEIRGYSEIYGKTDAKDALISCTSVMSLHGKGGKLRVWLSNSSVHTLSRSEKIWSLSVRLVSLGTNGTEVSLSTGIMCNLF